MNNPKLEELLAQIATLRPELAEGIKALTADEEPEDEGLDALNRNPKVGPLPDKSSITFMKTTLWDNGPEPKITKSGNTGKRTRYTATLEVYTRSLDRLVKLGLINTCDFKRNVQLRTRDRFLPLVKKNHASGRIDRDFLVEYTTDTYSTPDDLFGFVLDAGSWNYYSGQFVHLKWSTTGEPHLFVIHGDDVTEIITWNETENQKGEAVRRYENEIDYCGYRRTKEANSTKNMKAGRRPR